MIPRELIGQQVHINYRLRDDESSSRFHGTVEAITSSHVVLVHDGMSRFVRSYLDTDRIISIHTLKEVPHDPAGEDVPEGDYSGPAFKSRPGR